MMPRKCLLLVLLACGCDGSLAVNLPVPVDAATPLPNDRYDASANGTITGTVKWTGEQPTIPPFTIVRTENLKVVMTAQPNPNAPRIGVSGGLSRAVVWLRGIDPRRAKANSFPAVAGEIDSTGIHLLVNGEASRTAFVPLGAEVAFVNKLPGIGSVRGRGASFFTHMLPLENATARQTFTQPGRVELTSASMQHWTVADLFVCEHAYFTLSDDTGRFTFTDVPDGEYELICWHPNWYPAKHERDPETGLIARQAYQPAVEKRAPIRLMAGKTSTSEFSLSASDFLPLAKP